MRPSYWMIPTAILLAALAGAASTGPLPGDERLAADVQFLQANPVAVLLMAISYLGSAFLWDGLVLLAAAATFVKLDRFAGFALAFGLSDELVTWVVKHLVNRPRPPLTTALEHPTDPSFPSAHIVRVTVALGIALTLLVWPRPQLRLRCLAGAVLFTVLMGLSRVAVGVHWPSDVLGGAMLGALWATISIMLAAGLGQLAEIYLAPRLGPLWPR